MIVSKRHLLRLLKGRQIDDLEFRVETIEGEPKDGYKTYKAGQVSAHMKLSKVRA